MAIKWILFKKLGLVREEWRKKTPRQKWQIVFNAGKISSELIGVKVYGYKKDDWKSYTCAFIIIIFFCTAFNAMWFHYQRDQILWGLQATGCFGIVISVQR